MCIIFRVHLCTYVCVCLYEGCVCLCVQRLVYRCIYIQICFVIYVCLWVCVRAFVCTYSIIYYMHLCNLYMHALIQHYANYWSNMYCTHYRCEHAYYVFACMALCFMLCCHTNISIQIHAHTNTHTHANTYKHLHTPHKHLHTHPHPHTEAPHTTTILWPQMKPTTQCEHPSPECHVLNVAPYMKTHHSVIPHRRVFVVSGWQNSVSSHPSVLQLVSISCAGFHHLGRELWD